MSLPQAVASGPSAETPAAVKPLRVALGAGLLTALYLLVLFIAQPVPTRLLSFYGGAKNDVERHGGLEMVWAPPAGMSDEEVFARFHVGEHGAQVTRGTDGATFRIHVPGVREEDVTAAARRLGGEAGLEFHRVVRAKEMETLIRVLELPMKSERPVDAEVDQWRPDEGGDTKTDYYLIGDSIEAIEAKIAEARAKGFSLPPGTRFAFERVEGEQRTFYRTYVIDERVELDGGDIANATGTYDPNTNRPLVLLDFTRAGAEKFGQLTSEIVGEKLATMLGGQIYSAPVINSAIRGGRASITMGGMDAARQERERDMLISTLRAGALPTGGHMIGAHYVPPVEDAPMQWLARGTLALGGGALIALLVWALVRSTRPIRRGRPLATGPHVPWNRVGITLLAPLAVWGVTQISALGIDEEELLYNYGGTSLAHMFTQVVQKVSFGALGIMPVISAFIFVEVLAVIFPGWRRRRHAGPDARAPIRAAVAITAGTLLFVQGWFVTNYLYGLNNLGGTVIDDGMLPRLLVMSSFAIGTLVLVGVAALIREYGVGNGYGVLLVSGFVIRLGDWLDREGKLDGDLVVGAVACVVIAVAVITFLRWRVARVGEAPLRLPTSGTAPLGDVGGLVILLALLAQFSTGDVTARLYTWVSIAREHHLLLIAVMAALTLLWSFAFARPNVTRRLADKLGLTAPSRASWWAATQLSAGLLVLLGAIATVTAIERPTAAWIVDAMTVAMLAAVVLDIYDDTRARRTTLDRAWTLHQAQYIDLVSRSLDDAGIPHHMSGASLRTLLAFFGPFAAVDVLVAPEHVPAAKQRIRELFE